MNTLGSSAATTSFRKSLLSLVLAVLCFIATGSIVGILLFFNWQDQRRQQKIT
jgi:hypothetical protein